MGYLPGLGVLPVDRETQRARALGFSTGARVHRITLGGRGAEEHVVPTLVQAHPGDAVEFQSADHRVHTVVFLSDSLSADGLAFLRKTGQLSGPPLVSRGSHFLVRFDDAPPGRYPFLSEAHGGRAHGAVVVEPSNPSDSIPAP
jgi:plastocyanin